MQNYRDMTARQIAESVKAGKISALEIAAQALELARTEGAELNAFITLCEDEALQIAEGIDNKVKAGGYGRSLKSREKGETDKTSELAGKPGGLLAGVPVAIKDNICYTGCRTTCGSKILENYIPPYNATVVEKLLEAGAVIIGKTNMDEFAMGSSSETSYFGPVKHPLDKKRSPGGSSGGSAAAVARGIIPLALGSETGGSVRQPASFCGLYGLKPTYGAVSRYGLVAYCSSSDVIAPFARDTEDLALIYRVIAGHDEHDATITSDLDGGNVGINVKKKFKIGIPKQYFAWELSCDVSPVINLAIEALENAGHEFVDISLPLTNKAIAAHYIIAPAEASSNLARYDGVRYGLREGGDKKLKDMYLRTRTEGFGSEVKRRIMLGTYALSAGYYDMYYERACKVREMIRREFIDAFKKVDLIITPTAPTPAFRLGEKLKDPLAMYLCDVFTVPSSLAGVPAVSVPFGAIENPESKINMPVGVQFIAPHLKEASLFQISAILEQLKK
ncbi:MAG: Asp-tRNA(Asn)/Glu-tRNA(Gln) amidotransferase subunit GatA [candidate division Zixibacteria bacterium]|nr:Asp-tRNA(Asn)/Glu-tRNA(Gln) amidotransferase subunit GatA [candidate division Zixibacteria bacterium]